MEPTRRHVLGAALGAVAFPAYTQPRPSGYLKAVEAHLVKLIEKGTDVYGPVKTPMWMASLDTRTGLYPEDAKARAGQRVYRDIAAPRGSTIYWDQPQMAAAHAMARIASSPRFARAADDYVRSFLEHGIDEHGLFEWGNHRYYDAFTDKVVRFQGGPHEMRPVIPAWELFWRVSPAVTERQIRQSGLRHLFDPETGGFNRHDDQKPGCAFLESGGILIESLCWLHQRKKDRALLDLALKMARYSYSHRGSETGLLENNPTVTRWDKHVCTTEVGMWAGSLLRAFDLSGVAEFRDLADSATTAWLKHGYDSKARRYYGQVRVKDGTPVLTGKTSMEIDDYFPADHADIWNARFPTHDYPMAFAETCLDFYRRTKAPRYREAVERWVDVVKLSPAPKTAKDGRGAYAELFGRAIHFLTGAGQALGNAAYTALATKLADESLATLFAHGMFRSHAGEDRYDAVDGVGYLLLALIYLETGKKADYMGFGF